MVVGPVVVMQPFGEQNVFRGQQPPPSSTKHAKYKGRHVGIPVGDSSHAESVSVELQQYMFEGVRGVEWQLILTGQHMSCVLLACI